MKPVRLHSEAIAEFEDAVDWFNEGKEGLGDVFDLEVEAALRLIGNQPRAFSPYPGGYRRCYLGPRFTYSIFYLEYDDYVWVAAVYHTSREPDAWKNRVNSEGHHERES